MSPQTGLSMQGISHHFGKMRVVDDVSLNIAPGELVCLLGPSGCGKTTTLRIAAGLEAPDAGTVSLNGAVVSGNGIHLPPERRHVGFLFQDYALFPHLRVLGNVEFGIDSLRPADRHARAMEMLEQVGMADYAGSWPHQLSGGQQQRVALARALAPSPALMLLDEPFSGLDKRLRDLVRDETLQVLKRNKVATLMVTHDPEEAMFMADRVAVMRQGQVMQFDRPEVLYNSPADPFVAAFFGEVNQWHARPQGGMIRSPLGDFACSHDGECDVLARPEAVRMESDGAIVARVLTARPLGPVSLLHLLVADPNGGNLEIRARLACRSLPAEGEIIRLAVDPTQVFVYPRA
ncbi:MAG: ABC transporter ATP-binding protein [Magnetospirillum sp.]